MQWGGTWVRTLISRTKASCCSERIWASSVICLMATTFSDQRTCLELFGTTKQKKGSKSKPLHDFQLESYSKSKVSFNKFNDKIVKVRMQKYAKALSSKSWEKSSWPEMVFLRLSIVASFYFPKGSGLGVFWDLLCGVSRVPHGIFLSRPNAFVDLCSESSPDPRLQDQLTRWNFQQMQEILVTSAFEQNITRYQKISAHVVDEFRDEKMEVLKIHQNFIRFIRPRGPDMQLGTKTELPRLMVGHGLTGAPQTLRAPRAEDSGSSGSSGLAVKGPLFGDCVIYVDVPLCLVAS